MLSIPEFANTLIGRRLVISVPGSTTNLGPGFDAIGLALNVYSHHEHDNL